jgi:hypothetical protein
MGGVCDAGDDRQGPTVIDRDHSGVRGGPKLFKRGSAFESADLGEVLGVLGPRRYRTAHVEAGIVHGRLLLCAHALANGATGLTFFDEAVRAAFETTASWLRVSGCGRPTLPSTLDVVDDAGSPGRALAAYRDFRAGDVEILLGPYGSGTVRRVAPEVCGAGRCCGTTGARPTTWQRQGWPRWWRRRPATCTG